MAQNLDQQAKAIIQKILYVTVATASKAGQPWNSPVYSAFDPNYNFYWASWKENQHSKNIQENPLVFLVIYDSTVPEGKGRGVYLKATACELTNKEEIRKALATLYTKKGQSPHKRKPEEFLSPYPRRVYQAIPQKIWLNTDGQVNGHFVDKRVEIDLHSPIQANGS